MSVEPRDQKSVPDLLSGLLREATELFRTETRLIRSELSDKMTQLQVGGGSIAAGAICLLVALIVLAQALVIALTNVLDIDGGWAALMVGAVIAIIGVILLAKGKKELEPTNLVPERSVEQLRKDTTMVKEQSR
ncbi:phage holin family protein [Limoniibacter endophyticus]|uniref:Phage holin family protein n=1 Tax=Limoniibacter endophyticus TaxID=1565040 RepID=A0A8J3GHQ8_9HYPH|nr:phage holin family protein [Limoniibacter endophyticus]GHC72418.1 hypothetical protein GCM10010136_20110 [Limoniibacter endophyticus]